VNVVYDLAERSVPSAYSKHPSNVFCKVKPTFQNHCGEHKLRNFKARYLTTKLTMREYSRLGQFGTMTVNHFDFVEFSCANFPKLEYSRMVSFVVK